MNDKAQIAIRAIDKAMATIDDTTDTMAHLRKARNMIELLGAQCDAAEEQRKYWCNEAAKGMRRIDVLRSANSALEVRIKTIEVMNRGTLWPRKRA